MGSRFQVVQQGPPIEVFQLNKMFLDDPHPNKVNLSIGGKFSILFSNIIYNFKYTEPVTLFAKVRNLLNLIM